jgi:hypothetical protein
VWTSYNEYWKENIKLFTATDFIAELTQHLPPKRKHLIRYYGLYSSRSKGKSHQSGRYEKFGVIKEDKPKASCTPAPPDKSVDNRSAGQTWATAHEVPSVARARMAQARDPA